MPKFAILNNNVVNNIIICDTLEEAQTVGDAVQCKSRQENVAVGYIYNPETETFSEPTEDTNA